MTSSCHSLILLLFPDGSQNSRHWGKRVNNKILFSFLYLIYFGQRGFFTVKKVEKQATTHFLVAIKNPLQKKIETLESNFGGKKVSAPILPAFSY